MSDLSSIEYFAKIRKIMENISLKHMCRLIHIALTTYTLDLYLSYKGILNPVDIFFKPDESGSYSMVF